MSTPKLTDNQANTLLFAVKNQGIWQALAQRRCSEHWYPAVLDDLRKKGYLDRRGPHYYPTAQAIEWSQR